jgi:membrane protease YdiL (CAAX protease family)
MAPAAILLAFVGALFLGAVIIAISSAAGLPLKGRGSAAVNVLLNVAQSVAFIGAPLLLVASVTRRLRPQDFGLRRSPVRAAVGWLLVAAMTYFVFTVAWTAIVAPDQKQDDLFKSFGVSGGVAAVAVLGLIVCVLAPLGEEFLFRGFCFPALRPSLGVAGAALAVGLVFGAVHLTTTPPVLLVPLALFGVVLCLLRQKTGSLYPCIALHALNNSIAYGLLQHWDWQIVPLAAGALAVCALVLSPFRAREDVAADRALA